MDLFIIDSLCWMQNLNYQQLYHLIDRNLENNLLMLIFKYHTSLFLDFKLDIWKLLINRDINHHLGLNILQLMENIKLEWIDAHYLLAIMNLSFIFLWNIIVMRYNEFLLLNQLVLSNTIFKKNLKYFLSYFFW
jgi:hypothetical protein